MRSKIPVKAPDPNTKNTDNNVVSNSSEESEGLSHIDKVMIVTGDSQNMVVDLR